MITNVSKGNDNIADINIERHVVVALADTRLNLVGFLGL